MAFKTGFSTFLRLAWQEISSLGAGVEFSFYDHLQERIDQLEHDLTDLQQRPSQTPAEEPSGIMRC
jgi:hypothetical protein